MGVRAVRLLLVTAALGFVCNTAPSLPTALADDVKPESASELGAKVIAATKLGTARSLNEALGLLKRLDTACKDPAVREAVGYADLETQTVKARDTFFRKAVEQNVLKSMAKRIAAKAREKRPAAVPAPKAGPGPAEGTLAAARHWLMNDLAKLLWDGAHADLGLSADETSRYWKERSGKDLQTASYGTGTFIVRKPQLPAVGKAPPSPEETWWDAHGPVEREAWLTAYFVELSGIFDVVRIDESAWCRGCGGQGVVTTWNSDGTRSTDVCPGCRGAGKFREVVFR